MKIISSMTAHINRFYRKIHLSKCLSLMLAVCLIVSIFTSTLFSVGAWSTTGEKYAGQGTETDPYVIASLANLKYLSEESNDFSGKYIRLDADVDVSGSGITTIFNTFNGTFDGNGHTISNISIEKSSANAGFIIQTGGCTIKNLTLSGKVTGSSNNVGGFIGVANSGAKVKVINCVNKINVKGTYAVGGFIGRAQCASVEITDSVNDGNISATSTTDNSVSGGFIGILGDGTDKDAVCPNVNITSCINNGNVTSPRDNADANIGGFVGQTGELYSKVINIKFCQNNGAVSANTGVGGASVGGIIGKVHKETVNISYCINLGAITCRTNVGGIIGYNQTQDNQKITVSNCFTYAKLSTSATSGSVKIGAIFGQHHNEQATRQVCFNSFYNSDDIVWNGRTEDKGSWNYKNHGTETNSSSADWTNGTVLNALNSDGEYFVQGTKYPVFSDENWSTATGEKYEGQGTETDPYIIASLANLKYLSEQSNDFRGEYIRLDADIDVGGSGLTTILNTFNGTFDGNGHTISNISIVKNSANAGFIIQTSGCTLKNLTLTGEVTGGSNNIGGFIGIANGGAKVKLINCVNKINVKGTYAVGGFIGRAECALVEISDSINDGNISAISAEDNSVSGGFIGILGDGSDKDAVCPNVNITSCINNGSVTSPRNDKDANIGGFIGQTGELYSKVINIKFCQNNGAVSANTGVGGASVGGIIGKVHKETVNISYCINLGAITGRTNIGGIIGYNQTQDNQKITVSNCFTYAKLSTSATSGNVKIGPIFGQHHNEQATRQVCFNSFYNGDDIKLNGRPEDTGSWNYKKHGTEKSTSSADWTNGTILNVLNDGSNYFIQGTKYPVFSELVIKKSGNKYIKSNLPDGTIINIKYNEADKLSNIDLELDGYAHNDLWYEDADCTVVSTDVYPIENRTYYRAWITTTITEDFENRVVVNKFNPSSEYKPFYTNESKLSGGPYWMRSSWAVITSDANPKYSNSSYDRSKNNEYLKMTYLYQGMDMKNIERPIPTDGDAKYLKDSNPSWYKDYAYSAAFVLPNDSKAPTSVFYGDAGKEYTISLDIALVDDDDKKVEFYVTAVDYTEGKTVLNTISSYKPSEANGDILICSTEVTGDKNLALQSKNSYNFKTYKVTYKAIAGKTPVVMMVTNGGESINAPSTKTDFACAYVDNVVTSLSGKYFKSAMPDTSELSVRYEAGQRLADITVSLNGYTDDGKWYDDYDCTILSTDEYPNASKTYYRKWTKYFNLDFESEYRVGSSKFYKNPLDEENGGYATTYTRSDVIRPIIKNGNGVIAMTYCNENPAYTNSGNNFGSMGEYFHDYKYSPYLYLYDTGSSSKFSGSPGLKYKISFDYELEGPIPSEDVSFYLYLTSNKVSDSDAALNALTVANGSILCGKFDVNVAEGSKGRTAELEFVAMLDYSPRIVMVTNDGKRAEVKPKKYHTAYIDNITVVEEIPEGAILVPVTFDSNGGTNVSGFRVLKGNQIGSLPVPTKNGYLFDCWYLEDDADMKEVNSSYKVDSKLKLKAKWNSVTKSDYDNSGFDGFDNVRYPNILQNYKDLNMTTLYEEGSADSTMTAANRYIEKGCPDGMDSALLLSSSPAAMSNAKSGIAATALLNKDGTKFTVKAGTIYKLEFDYFPLGEGNAHSYIKMFYGSYTADTIHAGTATGIEPIAVHGIATEKSTASQYFYASKDGYVFFTLGSRQNFNNTDAEHFVLVDNVKITVENGAKSITYRNADTDSIISILPVGLSYYTQYGMPGDKIREFGIEVQSGKQIEGFYNDKECTKVCKDYDVITDTDRTVYVKFKDADYSKVSDFTNPIIMDFETSDDFDLEIMYRYTPYMTWTCTEKDNNVDYIGNDSKNAFEGSGYVRIKNYDSVYGDKGHSFILYDKENPSGIMILEPNTSYRISANVKYEDDAQIPSLKIWSVNLSSFAYKKFGNTTLTTTDEDIVGYGEIAGVITTGDTPVAVAIGAEYLAEQDVYIDNVKVEKLLECTIKFETNGGDPIEDISVLPYSDLTSYDPGYAFKPGYEFIGWYLDEQFTKPFDFLTDYVTEDIVLYAKYVKEENSEDEKQDEESYDNIGNEENGQETNEKSDPFGESLLINNADPAGKTDAIEKIVEVNNGFSTWIIIGIIAAGVLVLSGIAVLVIWLIKRKKA